MLIDNHSHLYLDWRIVRTPATLCTFVSATESVIARFGNAWIAAPRAWMMFKPDFQSRIAAARVKTRRAK
jgi:hypothetical protein